MELFISFYPVFIVLFIFLIVSAMRSSKKLLTKKPKNLFRIYSTQKLQIIIKSIIKFSADKKYEIDYFDADEGKIILSKPLGFFSKEGDKILIEIGIISKAVQIGPIPKRILERCINGIKAYLYCAGSN